MDQTTARTVREIEEVRERLGTHLEELEEKIPGAPTLKRAARVALGGGAGTTVLMFVLRRIRKSRAKRKAERPVVVEMLPREVSEAISRAVEDGSWRGWAAGFGAAWMLFRLAELRQLRRMRTAMLAR